LESTYISSETNLVFKSYGHLQALVCWYQSHI